MRFSKTLGVSTSLAILASLFVFQPAEAAIDSSFGYDVSWPQCGRVLPSDGAFRIVGVNNGLAFSDNPCFEEQLSWAQGTGAQLYINTGNPGPELSRFWPLGQKSPRICKKSDSDSLGCAFNYGYNFAEYAYKSAERSYQNIGLAIKPKDSFIWLDVEIENSWRNSKKKNVYALQGAVHYLEKVARAKKIGFYSNYYQWGEITGSTKVFEGYPSWVATASNPDLSIEACAKTTGFTGGGTRLTQYIDFELDLDVNVNCLAAPQVATTLTNIRPEVADKALSFSLKGKLITASGSPVPKKEIVIKIFGDRYITKTTKFGNFSLVLTAPKRARDYEVYVRFRGAKFYAPATVSYLLVVQ